jgi:coenzyme F420-reducing hydrogenase beta subunit
MRRRVIALVAVLLVVASAVWYGHAPPRSAQAYQSRAEETAEALRSQARAAELWVRAAAAGTVTRQAATVAIEDAESDARATASRFDRWDPPPELASTRTELTSTGAELVETLTRLRVATHERRWEDLPEVAGGLGPLADRLTGDLTALRRGLR